MNVSFNSISCQNGSVVLTSKPTPVQTEQEAVEKHVKHLTIADLFVVNLMLLLQPPGQRFYM